MAPETGRDANHGKTGFQLPIKIVSHETITHLEAFLTWQR
jgi:hypothetical protein